MPFLKILLQTNTVHTHTYYIRFIDYDLGFFTTRKKRKERKKPCKNIRCVCVLVCNKQQMNESTNH